MSVLNVALMWCIVTAVEPGDLIGSLRFWLLAKTFWLRSARTLTLSQQAHCVWTGVLATLGADGAVLVLASSAAQLSRFQFRFLLRLRLQARRI